MSWEGDFTTAGQPSLDKVSNDSFFSGPLVFFVFFILLLLLHLEELRVSARNAGLNVEK